MTSTAIKTTANTITTTLIAICNKYEITDPKKLISPKNFAEIIKNLESQTINKQGVDRLLEEIYQQAQQNQTNFSIQNLIQELGLAQVSDDKALIPVVSEVIQNNTTQVEQYKAGKVQVIGYLVGQCMKINKSGSPAKYSELLKVSLDT